MAQPDPFALPRTGLWPWIGADHSYAGWVPNVSGHLSFKLVDPFNRQATFNHQARIALPRTLVVHRTRFAQDYPFPDLLVRTLRRSASQDYLLLGESGRTDTPWFKDDAIQHSDDANGVLCGFVAVLPRDSLKAADRQRRALLTRIDQRIAGANLSLARKQYGPSERLARSVFAELKTQRAQTACYLMRFALFRTGELRLWFDLEELLGRDLAAEPATAKEQEMAADLSHQTYYFVKDLFHAHYHHNPKDDQLLPLTELGQGGTDQQVEQDEIAWRSATLRGMTRVAIEYRQGKTIRGHKKAVGVIAYAQSFQDLLGRTRRGRRAQDPIVGDDKVIPYRFENMIRSIDAADANAQAGSNAYLQLFAILVGVVLSGFALWAGAVQIKPILCDALGPASACPRIEPGAIVGSVSWIVANPTAFVVGLLIAGFFIFLSLFGGANSLPVAERTIRWIRQFNLALGVDLSRLTRRTFIGWVLTLFAMAGLFIVLIAIGLRLLPYTPPAPRVSAAPDPWTGVQSLAGQRLAESGLLQADRLGGQFRALLGSDFASWVDALGPEAPITTAGGLLVITRDENAAAGNAYALVHPGSRRIEAGLRRPEGMAIYRSPGRILTRPARIQQMASGNARSDAAGQEPMSKCILRTSATTGLLEVTGRLGRAETCDFLVSIRSGQSIALTSAPKGFDVRFGRALLPKDGRPLTARVTATGLLMVTPGAAQRAPAAFSLTVRIK